MAGSLKVVYNAFVQFKVLPSVAEKFPQPELSLCLSTLAWSQVSAGTQTRHSAFNKLMSPGLYGQCSLPVHGHACNF